LLDEPQNGAVDNALGDDGHELGVGNGVEGLHDTIPTTTLMATLSG
jgi:hypothetical protein